MLNLSPQRGTKSQQMVFEPLGMYVDASQRTRVALDLINPTQIDLLQASNSLLMKSIAIYRVDILRKDALARALLLYNKTDALD